MTLEHKPDRPRELKRILRHHGEVRPIRRQGAPRASKGINRVWLKGKDLPGLTISRSIGDKLAHSVGVIAIPGNQDWLTSIDVQRFRLHPERHEYTMVIASDGMWHMLTPAFVDGMARSTFSDQQNPDPDSEDFLTAQLFSKQLADAARDKWEAVSSSKLRPNLESKAVVVHDRRHHSDGNLFQTSVIRASQ